MCVDYNVAYPLPIGIEKSQASAGLPLSQLLCPSVTDDHILAATVIANVVGIIGKFDTRQDLKCSPVEDLGDSIESARDKQMIRGAVIEYSLWEYSLRLRQVGDRVNSLPGLQVDHFACVVVDGGYEKSLAFDVNTQIIDPTFDIG
jgi:hypothetical protein